MCVGLARAGLTAFFSEHANVRSIRMRKHLGSGDFKGSVFLELDSVEEARALMAKELVHEGAKLVRGMRAAALLALRFAHSKLGAAAIPHARSRLSGARSTWRARCRSAARGRTRCRRALPLLHPPPGPQPLVTTRCRASSRAASSPSR